MKSQTFTFLFACACALSACATVKTAKEKTFATPKKDAAAVYFYREDSFQGSLINWTVFDTKVAPAEIGTLKNGSYFYSYLPAGDHRFALEKDSQRPFEITLKAGQTYYFQCRLDMGMVSSKNKIAEVTENEGLRAIKDPDMVMVLATPK